MLDIFRYSLFALLGTTVCARVDATESIRPGLYEITAETSMPHLEEGLRYATTRGRRCLSDRDLATVFPTLSQDALKGCALSHEIRHADSVSYRLVCDGGRETTGTAHWLVGPDRVSGRLDVRLGGKNMTFSQHVDANRLGDCVPDAR